MKRKEAFQASHGRTHMLAPKEWQSTPDITGDYDLDATLLHRHNKDLPHRLDLYVKDSLRSYGARTAYNSYRRYSGDA